MSLYNDIVDGIDEEDDEHTEDNGLYCPYAAFFKGTGSQPVSCNIEGSGYQPQGDIDCATVQKYGQEMCIRDSLCPVHTAEDYAGYGKNRAKGCHSSGCEEGTDHGIYHRCSMRILWRIQGQRPVSRPPEKDCGGAADGHVFLPAGAERILSEHPGLFQA